MKTLFIIYHEDLEAQVRGVLHRGMVVPRYTRVDGVVGARMAQMEAETGYMTDRRNRMILVIGEEDVISKLINELRLVSRKEGHGLRGFVVDASTVF